MAKRGLVHTNTYATPLLRIGNGQGAGLHWPDLDEYVSVRSILLGRRSAEGSDRDDRPVQE